jgi:ZIP family zinc transporter
MEVLLTAIGVGLSTVIGALIGFLFKNISHRVSDYILAFAGGVMLSAAFFGLILPSFNEEDPLSLVVSIIGIFSGALVVFLADKLVPHLHRTDESDIESHPNSARANKVLLFVSAIAIHNIPEGIAAGVGFGGDDVTGAITIALGIALQNIPEGMVIIAPMLSVGMSKRKTLLIAALTGLAEVFGTFLGYFATGISYKILPFALAFAGGTMLYIVSDEMIPETHSHGNARGSTFALLFRFVLMMVVDALI